MTSYCRIFILLFFCGFINFLVCNNSTASVTLTDSLENLLKTTKDKKSELSILNSLSKEYSSISFDKSIEYGNQALNLSKRLNNQKEEVQALINIGEAYSYNNKINESDEYYVRANELSKKTNYAEGSAKALYSIGYNYLLQNKIELAFIYYNQSLVYSRKCKDKKSEGKTLYYIGQAYKKKNDYQNAEKFSNQALVIFKEINDATSIAQVYNSLGLFRYELGQYDKAIEFYELSLKYRMISGDRKSAAIMYNNMGNVFYKWGHYPEALTNYQNALKIFEEINFQIGIASCLNNIGLIYEHSVRGDEYEQNVTNYNKALEYFEKALSIWEKLKNEREIANSYNNIGNIHTENYSNKYGSKYGFYWEDSINDKDRMVFLSAIEYHKKALKLREKMDDKTKIAGSLQNIGKNYSITRNFDLGLYYQEKALKLYKQQGIENSDIYTGIGRLYHRKGNYQKALENLKKGLDLSIKNKTTLSTKYAYDMLSNVYASMGDYKQSLEAYKKFAKLQDSLVNQSLKETTAMFEIRDKEKENELLKKDAKLKDAQVFRTILFFTAGLILVLVVAIFQIRQNRERKKTNTQLEAKNHLITEQKKEITDSIQYASRIQKAVMTVETQLKQILPNSFIFFRPRDIVSGDFFWVNEKNNKIIVVAADCTGHGVPGAFMSMLGMSMFKNIVAEMDDLHADLILNELRKHIIDALHQTGKEGENKDGMDLALYIIDSQAQSVEYAGANNPLYIVRDGNLIETKADRMPIGIHEKSFEPFTRHNIPIQKGDMIYTFSDGYHDQFGGDGDRKFMSGNLKKLFVKIYNEPVEKQHQILEETITNWMKNTHQIDDQLIIGVRV